MRSIALLSFLAVLVLAVPGISPGAVSGEISLRRSVAASPEQTLLQQGIERYESGNLDEALGILRSFVIQNYDSPLLPRAYLYLARIFLDSGRLEEAMLYLDRIPAEKAGPEALLIRGALLIASDLPRQGVRILQDLERAEFSLADQALRYSYLARGKERLAQNLQALFFIHRALSLPENPARDDLLDRAHRILKEELTMEELDEASFMFAGSPLGEDALLQKAVRIHGEGREQEARQLLERVVQSPTPFPYRREAVRLLEDITGNVWLDRSIGVILPLSGRYATFGNLVRRGMDLAIEIHNQNHSPVEFIYKDSGADREQGARAVEELVYEDRVIAIAGPLTGTVAETAAEAAQRELVPLLALSQRKGIPETGDFIFRNSLTTRLQVEAIVRYAMEERLMRKFGLLYPQNRLGEEFAELFIREVEIRGGDVSVVESYAEEATDFRRQIMRLRGKNPDAPEEKPDENSAQPAEEPPFDALFIPDYADRIGLIVPQVAFYGLENMPLLGINGWNSPDLVEIAGPYVEGAVFVDGFFRYSHYPFVQEFVNLYFEKYGEEPTILEAQGFDVAGILLSLLGKPEVVSRVDLRRALDHLQNYPGVTGSTLFNEQGDAEKVLFLLQVQNGNIVQVN